MRIRVDTSSIRLTRWYEYLIRFVLGGAVTVAAGLIAKGLGPRAGGLFLAFPAILAASATLIDKHERERKERAGVRGIARAKQAVGADAAGAAIGSFGMATFAILVWKLLPEHSPLFVLSGATLAWFAVAFGLWTIRRKHTFVRRKLLHRSASP